jgi:oxygen-independent coproporphyrinogen-3 oxidase
MYLPPGQAVAGPCLPQNLEKLIIPDHHMRPTTAYFHIPFCRGLCRFCVIQRRPAQREAIQRFLEGIHQEMDLAAASPLAQDIEIKAVAMGGGTPTCLEADELIGLVLHLRADFTCKSELACSLEASTHTSRDQGKLEALAGTFNRISFGVQTFRDELRRAFGMQDNAEKAVSSVHLARQAGFNNMNIDLFYNLPGQTEDELKADLSRALELDLESYTIYPLTVYPSSPLAGTLSLRRLPAQPGPEVLGRHLEVIAEVMDQAGYRRFWLNQYIRDDCFRPPAALNPSNYLAFGPAAFGTMHRISYYNLPDLEAYLLAVSQGLLPHECACAMSDEHWALRKFYYLFLQLRVGWDQFTPGERALLENLLAEVSAGELYTTDSLGLTPSRTGRRHADAFMRALARVSGQRLPHRS